jgi:hypothetical protein
MQPEAETHRMQLPSNGQLWLRIRRSNSRHQGAALSVGFQWLAPKSDRIASVAGVAAQTAGQLPSGRSM